MSEYIPASDDGAAIRRDINRELENLGVTPGTTDSSRLILSLLRDEWDRRHKETA